MNAVTFDRHIYIKRFKAKGMSEELAEEVTDAIKASKDTDISHLATKEELKTALAEAKADIIKYMFTGFIAVIGLLVAVLFKLH